MAMRIVYEEPNRVRERKDSASDQSHNTRRMERLGQYACMAALLDIQKMKPYERLRHATRDSRRM